jgi:A/G-specific adenine glycosylase
MPNLVALANISEQELLKCWEGLGYYSRARNLQKTAKLLVSHGKCELPETYTELLKLPGIGEYTAGAIASFAFDETVPAVDGNVMRVLARLTASDTDVLSPAGKKEFTNLAKALLPLEDAGRFNQAIMELGETICLPNGAPHCEKCPFGEICEARKKGMTTQLPVRKKLKPRKMQEKTVLLIHTDSHFLLHRRSDDGLLAGLFEFPMLEGNQNGEQCKESITQWGLKIEKVGSVGNSKHIFTHIEWHMTGFDIQVSNKQILPGEYIWVTKQEMQQQYALPSAFRHFTKYIDRNV